MLFVTHVDIYYIIFFFRIILSALVYTYKLSTPLSRSKGTKIRHAIFWNMVFLSILYIDIHMYISTIY